MPRAAKSKKRAASFHNFHHREKTSQSEIMHEQVHVVLFYSLSKP